MQREADDGRGDAPPAIGVFRDLARHPESGVWRDRAQLALPYLIGAAMFGIAVWVLHSALRRYGLADLHAELAELTFRQIGLAILFTFCSFLALIGYEWSALGLVGKRMPFDHLALASFATQSIAHSTGFAFVIGATLRYHFYADRGLGITDVAKVQMFFTATFTLGVATLAGAVVMIEPWRLAAATGLPPVLWRLAAAMALALVIAYVIWGGFFHRPLRWRGRELILPGASATLTQIFFGVADLLAVAAALYVLLPAELGLGYIEVLAVFMASIVIGLISHVPGSLGVFESAVVLLVQPTEVQTLPLIGSLLAFRAVYYLLPLACGVSLLAITELHRWRGVLSRIADRIRLDLGPGTARLAASLVGIAGLTLILVAVSQSEGEPSQPTPLALGTYELGWAVEIAGGLGLLLLAHGLWRQWARSWRWALALLVVVAGVAVFVGATIPLGLSLVVLALLLFAVRGQFQDGPVRPDLWQSPGWAVLVAVTVASGFWLVGRG